MPNLVGESIIAKTTMIVKRVQTIVDTIAKECRERFGDKVTLIWFGSWVNAYKESDIDLAIEYHEQLEQLIL